MWPNFDGKPYTKDQLTAHVASLDFSKWRRKDGSRSTPKFITLHNTSQPTIKLWLSWPAEKRQQYIRNMQPYYANMGWKGGPHFFVPPQEDIAAFGFNDPTNCGTHCSCFNSDSIGIEMVGEFNVEGFDDGPGALVRDNAVLLMALLYNKLGLDPAHYIYGKSGLHFHVECHADNHDCPGKHVSKSDVIARVKAKMATLAGSPVSTSVPTSTPASATPTPEQKVVFSVSGKMSTFGGPRDTGMSRTEGLGLFATAQAMHAHGADDLLLPEAQAGAPGLGRRLDPKRFYLACRWDISDYPFLRDAVAHVSNPKTGKSEIARPVDWGPNARTGRVADLSPGLAEALGLNTDEVCVVTVYADGK